MIKKTIPYTDYDGTERTEDFYFNLSMSELMEMQTSVEGGMRGYIQRIMAANDQTALMKLFKDVLLMTYGKKSDDGRLFLKNDAIRAEFEASPAFSAIYMELMSDAQKAADFINGLIPANLRDQNPAMNMAATANAVPALSVAPTQG